jgi:hypothetical protein
MIHLIIAVVIAVGTLYFIISMVVLACRVVLLCVLLVVECLLVCVITMLAGMIAVQKLMQLVDQWKRRNEPEILQPARL